MGATALPVGKASANDLANLRGSLNAEDYGVRANATDNQSRAFEAMLAEASARDEAVFLPAGVYVIGGVTLPARTRLSGVPGATQLVFNGSTFMLQAREAEIVSFDGITFDGLNRPFADGVESLCDLRGVRALSIDNCTFRGASRHGLYLERVGGRVERTLFSGITEAALWSVNAAGLSIERNTVTDCANGGIWVHRWEPGNDATQVISNRIARIGSTNGGTGQWGNGINVFRADNVMVSNNTIEDCAFSAIRSNSGSNVQITGNHCRRSGETALYSEFQFEGAIISGNVVDGATMGISIANFNEGGRLAVCSGNLVRNLKTVGPYPPDEPGYGMGISIEADTSCTGNVIEGAPLFGIKIGWGNFMRNVVAAGNVIRDAGTGIYYSAVEGTGNIVVTDNVFDRVSNAAIAGFRWSEQVTGEMAFEDRNDDRMTIARNRAA